MRDDEWAVLSSFFPAGWKDLAVRTKAVKGLRKAKGAGPLLRTLLLHVGCGYSLRETAVRAKQAGLGELSDVAVLKRLRKSREWLYELCQGLFAERGLSSPACPGLSMRVVDATSVKEPGRTGSVWRIHFSLRLPALQCDYFKVTGSEGPGSGETFRQFPLAPGDLILGDGAYSTAPGARYVASRQAFLTARFNPKGARLEGRSGEAFLLREALESELSETGRVAVWPVRLVGRDGQGVRGRICALRKSPAAIELACKRIRRRASKRATAIDPDSFVYARYVVVFTTFPAKRFPAAAVVEWYRVRWQIELVFKRFKQMAQLGHLPKYDDDSSKAWLYGKLFFALLAEKVRDHAKAFSPWGYSIRSALGAEPLA
jgi:hypothetical protein